MGGILLQILFLSLALLGCSQSTYKYEFPVTATSTYQTPSYPLGTLRQGDYLSISIELPLGGAMLLSSYVLISIMDVSNSNSIVTFDDSNPSHCNGGSMCTLSWSATASGGYYLRVLSVSPNTEHNSLALYSLVASVNNIAILRIVDVLRQHIIKYFYVANDQTVSMTVAPFASSGRAYFTLLTMSPATSGLTVLSSQDLTPDTVSGDVGTFSEDLAQGYYAVAVHTDAPYTVTITTQSDPYPCPYSNGYTDFFTVFTGCTRSAVVSAGSGLPCLSYDYNAQVCLVCMDGFKVSQGVCVINNNCTARKYYKFGNCYDVSPSCGQYDPFAGSCLTCASSQDMLISGQCITNTNFCEAGSHLVDSYCVSDTCGSYSRATRQCLSCITAAYYLSSGLCLPVNCGPNRYFSVGVGGCAVVPPTCNNFSIALEACYSCLTGYVLVSGVCSPDSNTNNCQLFNVTANACAACNSGYYLLGGGCAKNPTCSIGQTLVNGLCVPTPIICTPSQTIVNNQCADLPDHCLSLNIYFQCTSCSANYQLVAGACQICSGTNPNFPCLTCPTGMFVDNQGRCQPFNQYCGSTNVANGLCITCRNGQAPVLGNCCDFGQVYQNGACVTQQASSGGSTGSGDAGASSGSNSEGGSSSGGNGGSAGRREGRLDPNCLTISPETKLCTSCRNGHFMDSAGNCI